MKYELILAARARADILRNAEWWAENHSPDQAISWFDSIYQELENLRVSNRLDPSWQRKPTYRTEQQRCPDCVAGSLRRTALPRRCIAFSKSHLGPIETSSVSRYFAAHRSRRIQTNHNRYRQLQHVSTGDLGCLMQCSADLLRNVQVRVQVRSKVLVRELLRSSNLRLVCDPASNVVHHIVVDRSAIIRSNTLEHGVIHDIENPVPQQRIEIPTQRLRTHLASQCSPNRRSLSCIRVGQKECAH